ncbi:hypothetical protein ABFT23_03025 [Nocardioides sp. C4-1]|uniref:hypothetical protein n=1 Tax=Nocardioides sp. C4-1 TaxID=3151851 RepID=UPI0032642C77
MSTEPDPISDLEVQESTVARILELLEEAARLVAAGQPRWVDPDMFGGTVKGERMARHTLRAQARVYDALDGALATLARHHGSLVQFTDEIRALEDEMDARLTELRGTTEATL